MNTATAQPEPGLLPVALRDSAYTVAELASDSPPLLPVLRHQCDTQIASLREELQMRGLPLDVIDDALYAQCALLDEAALKGLTDDARDAWEREPLQVRVFGRNDAGDELLRRIDQRLRERQPVLPLLAIFAAILDLGFTGRFAVHGGEARASLMHEIDLRLGRTTDGTANHVAEDTSGPVVVNASRPRTRPLSPLAWVFAACIAAGLAWSAIDRWLLASIARMAG
ncbi:DotU family type IV/VI secretion system protein [Paraburkholderia rhizosphaerae]|uniref:Type VI secretion system protein ImpK n=1 Tax=Paraburkholderia rhizosphaerae TaxID=480658 RepID=A0A4R8M0C8_9BURK|nr:DotU/TssL family secretion system protein [Paraburkholderia rhizosphaerae]TDY53976.1 type VI secretion system protein ImpK [Paraburkholderia rhizosphaerae]